MKPVQLKGTSGDLPAPRFSIGEQCLSPAHAETKAKSFMLLLQATHLITHGNFHLPSLQLDLQANVGNYENRFLKTGLILKLEIIFQRLGKILGVK